MKAIQVKEPGVIQMVDVEKPEIKNDDEVLVRVRAFGICGSDVGILKGTNPFATYPRILGHEVAGEVFEVGRSVKNLKVGDKVVLEPIEFCGECYACTHNHHNVCSSLEVYGVHRDGGFCEYLVANENKWHKVDDDLSFEMAAVAEPYTIGEQSTSRAEVSKGDFVLITGAGPAGLLATDCAKMKGGIVIVSEINGKRRNMAREFGASYVIDPMNENLSEKIMEITKSEGVNVLIDTSGVEKVIEEATSLLSPASRFVPLAFGSFNIPINFKTLNQKEITIKGTRLQYEKFPVVAGFLHEKKDLLEKFVTHTFKAEDYKEAFDLFMKKDTDAIKVVLTFD